MLPFSNPAVRAGAAIAASAVLAALYVRGGWVFGFVFLVPWLRNLDTCPSVAGALLRAWAMAVAFTGAGFAWFGMAIGDYAQIGTGAGLGLLLLAAPLFQPQFLAYALVRHATLRQHGAALAALAAAAAWVGLEWLVPKLLGDTLGYGLHPARLLRQGADLGGPAGLTLLLLLANEALAAALARRRQGLRASARPLALAGAVPLLLAGYGALVLAGMPSSDAKPLRVGLIQANIVNYERQRQEKGSYAVVREVLGTHLAMSYDAVERQGADAVLWSETVYPTTFGQPRSEAGAAFDRAILDAVSAAGVPFVFGTYDRDSAGEYNAAAFVQPGTGLVGFYRKTRLFPLTEYVPRWLDSAQLRRTLPWTGNWQSGNGARVFPLLLKDGREIPVLPLICFDDVDSTLAINGARLGAQAILTMSNDSWFTAGTLGAQLHQSAAAFRSIETRLPQFRVTTSGYSAVIDASGSVLAGSRMGERTLVIGDVAPRKPAMTLVMRWGDWVGRAAMVFLAALGAWSALRRWRPRSSAGPELAMDGPLQVALLTPAARAIAGLLRAVAGAGLAYLCVALLQNEALRLNTLAQARMFATFILAPLAASWCVLYLFAARAAIDNGQVVVTRGRARETLALADIAAVQLWRLLLPCPGLSLHLASGRRWHYGLATAHPQLLAAALARAGCPTVGARTPARVLIDAYVHASVAVRRSRLDHPLVRYALLSLALAIPAFHLQQHIAYGGAFGEYYTFGLRAYLSAFAIWWAAWAIGVALCDAALRLAVAAATLVAAAVRPGRAIAIRRALHHASHALLFLGMPAWLLMRVYGS
ncbi:apolipoprotein N-acyltransferase [Massilia sp. PAMC28688]|uniref:apolipoprotein N-acyltransferase n=1 Tax=Massilia sp. PAMC28688 TaxID=2861283 RepID=UPI001C63900A|nr:apolipoprotein N-acyltransferase [Massilia sp. PAMC28688]QYF92646.1 apolipoprotein N-acyltransferase [Massilia sp. PAMC28688]